MSAQTNRPTPEQLADDCRVIARYVRDLGSFFATCRAERLEHLVTMLDEGAVIVHPDDVPDADLASPSYQLGWSDCRAHIFRADQ